MTVWGLTALASDVQPAQWPNPSEQPRHTEQLRADSLPSGWQYTPERQQDASMDASRWWTSFNDSMLDSLIAAGLDNNYDVAMAARRVEIARQTLKQVSSQYFPSLQFSGGWNKARTSGAVVRPDADAATTSAWQLGIDMSWEIDLFGRISAQRREKGAQYHASRAQFEAMQVAVAAKIAAAYMQLRTLQTELAVAQDHARSQEMVYEIAHARFKAGLNSKLDVAQASMVLFSTRASVPNLEAQIDATITSIQILLGTTDPALAAALARPAPMPGYLKLLPVGVPADLLRRRPDIREAELAVAADAAAVGIAKKEFLPKLSLNGSIGTGAHNAGDLFKNNSLTYAIAPTLTWVIFDGLARNYAVAVAKEQMQADVDAYNLAVTQAVAEVNSALAQYSAAVKAIEMYAKVADAAKESVTLSVDLYRGGLDSFTDVENAQINYLTYANMLVEAQGNALAALVAVYQALGGAPIAE